ncbi:MAG: shikimate dehydrogenase [Ruminococcus sp.]|nr:shikimate dehydrogenase [Ruminococcus sp.]
MEKYTLIGHPLGHSMSPFIHERLFAMSGKEAEYSLTDIAPENLTEKKAFLRDLKGFNITIPHKMAIIPLVDKLDDSAKRYNSVNCVANVDSQLVGYNTDCDGFTMSVKDYPMDGKVLLIGCGGVGRMMATEALRSGADLTIGIIPQDEQLVKQFLAEVRETMPEANVQYRLTTEIQDSFDVILNASPVGMFPKINACPVPDILIEKASHFFDVVYNPMETLLLQKAKSLGKVAKGGAAMLVLQAVRAHEIWYGGNFTQTQINSIIRNMEVEIDKQNKEAKGA